MKKSERNQTMKMTTTTGEHITVNLDIKRGIAEVITSDANGKLIGRHYLGATIDSLQSKMKSGAEIRDARGKKLVIKEVTQSIPQEIVVKVDKKEKRGQLAWDRTIAYIFTMWPGAAAYVLELQETFYKAKTAIGEEATRQTDVLKEGIRSFLEQLPFPVLYEFFENAPPEVRFLLAPMLVPLGIIFGGGEVIAQTKNKLRYRKFGKELQKHFKGNANVNEFDLKDRYKEHSKAKHAEKAFNHTKEEFERA